MSWWSWPGQSQDQAPFQTGCACVTTPCTCGGIVPGVSDVSVSDTLRSAPDVSLGWPLGQRNSSSPQDVPRLADARTTSDVPTNSDLPRTWDQMSWLQKANVYLTSIIPGAVGDTIGITERPGAQTVTSTIQSGVQGIGSSVILPLVLVAGSLLLILLIVRRVT